MTLNVLDRVPPGLLERDAAQLHEILPGPTLIHLPGRREEPLFVSVLLHGDEVTGWLAARELLQKYHGAELPRSLSLFIGNVRAARFNERFLDDQPDHNRIWKDTPENSGTPERRIAQQVLDDMSVRRVFACADVHNNSGRNPHYGCISDFGHRFVHLATLFSRTVLHFTMPDTVLSNAFSPLCPAVTLECGQPGQPYGVAHTLEYLDACLRLSEIPDHPVAPGDMDLYEVMAVVKVTGDCRFGPGDGDEEIEFIANLDHFNFRELPAGTVLGWIRRPGARLDVRDEAGRDVGSDLLTITGGEIATAVPLMPSMLTIDSHAVRQDCLGYFMRARRDFF